MVNIAFFYAYTQVLGRSPPEADLQRYFDVTPPSVHRMVLTLERLGFLCRQRGVARSIGLLIEPETLPILRSPGNQPVKSSVCRGTSPGGQLSPAPRSAPPTALA